MTAKIQTIVAEQGAALSVTLTRTDGDLTGRNLRMHVRSLVGEITTKLVASTTDGRLTVASPTSADLLIPSDIMAAVSVTDAREQWVYDVESWTTAEDVRREWQGAFPITRDVTRDTEAMTEDALAGLVRYDSPQSLTDDQKTQARDNIGAGTGGGGGSGDVVGPASSTDGRLALFSGTTGKLLAQGSVTGAAVASHLGDTANPHSVTAAQVGADPTGTAAAAIVAHAAATDPHGDRAFATSAVSTHNGVTTAHGISAFGATLVDDADAAAARTTLGAQATLVSATNIKTINSTSLLGSGDIAISASPGGSTTQVQFNSAGAFLGASDFTYSGGVVSMQYAFATAMVRSNVLGAYGNNNTTFSITASSSGDYPRLMSILGCPATYAPYGTTGGAINIAGGAGTTTNGSGGAINIGGGAKSGSGTEGDVNLGYTGSASIGAVKSWGKHTFAGVAVLAPYTVATVPSASTSGAGATIYVSDETGGAVLAFSDATNWRRVTDRSVIA